MDTLGNLTQVLVHATNEHDTKAGCDVLKAGAEKHGTLEAFSGDAGYRGTAVEFVETALKLTLHISHLCPLGKRSRIPLPSCRHAGSWNGRLLGWAITGGLPRILKY
jgi:hypothetical protein